MGIKSISPVDGRYNNKVKELENYFSEFALIKTRLEVELKWFKKLVLELNLNEDKDILKKCDYLLENFDEKNALRVKEIEKETNHDVKAVEYFIKENIKSSNSEFFHFGLTSEDINNTSYALMVKRFRDDILVNEINNTNQIINKLAIQYKSQSIMSRTHGQAATPSTFGKEIGIFAIRTQKYLEQISSLAILGKFNGATGNWAAMVAAYPKKDWIKITKEFIESIGLEFNDYSIQIEPHDWLVNLYNLVSQISSIYLDMAKDIWLYISRDLLKLKLKKGEIGSSTMPHKVNPIDFENAWGNFDISIAYSQFFARKLPFSMLQRDLTDSTIFRNCGVVFAHMIIGLKSLKKGLSKIEVNSKEMNNELAKNPQLLAEAIQTVMRRFKIPNAYEMIKEVTRGKDVTVEDMHEFINKLDIPDDIKNNLLELTPEKYIGLSVDIVDKYFK